ncbi:NAD-dependent epimerase/dehydratase family protein [Faecalibacillus intestinalis]|uniref:NAD-dependent epimerase/dehydratase family protein n=1 Tax=Faecalibacillus intestinalis TaxID=1982626 RepID=UPI000E54C3BF|nr:NAD(P)-dependent oxidoreductase [Faecalibacillus intestinalis]RHP54601.1 NAD(P)-dependent oxidoreductase [Coprobacillus sp. AF31-1BH]
MKVLVTGANGYLGQGICKELIKKGITVIATDFSDEHIVKECIIKCANIFEIDDPYEYFDKPDILIHLAWRNGFVHNSITHIEDLPMHYNFLKKFVNAGISKMAVLGSMHEIGFYEGSIDEFTPANPQSLYGISKNSLRQLMELECNKTNTILYWLRGFYIVGNTKSGCSIFSKITQAEMEGKSKFPFTMGLNQFDFIDYNTFCEMVVAVVRQNGITGIVNICSGRPEKLADRVERFIKENNYKIQLDYGKFPDRPYDSKAVWGNSNKIDKIMSKSGD